MVYIQGHTETKRGEIKGTAGRSLRGPVVVVVVVVAVVIVVFIFFLSLFLLLVFCNECLPQPPPGLAFNGNCVSSFVHFFSSIMPGSLRQTACLFGAGLGAIIAPSFGYVIVSFVNAAHPIGVPCGVVGKSRPHQGRRSWVQVSLSECILVHAGTLFSERLTSGKRESAS